MATKHSGSPLSSSPKGKKASKKTAPSPEIWSKLRSLAGSVTGPEDLAAEHDHYLYGTPKKSES